MLRSLAAVSQVTVAPQVVVIHRESAGFTVIHNVKKNTHRAVATARSLPTRLPDTALTANQLTRYSGVSPGYRQTGDL